MKTLIVIDVQHDFLPGGALGVPKGDEIIPIINALIPYFDHVIATLDWHPSNHMSFAETHGKQIGDVINFKGIQQILWPVHCVQNTFGAEIAAPLNKKKIEKIFHKGTDAEVDSYSAFFDNAKKRSTGLHEYLKSLHVQDLYFVGLATDYCVLYSVLDALELKYFTTVIRDGCRAINLEPNDEERALKKMETQGAKIITSKQVLR